MLTSDNINYIYAQLCYRLSMYGEKRNNGTIEIPHTSFCLTNVNNSIITTDGKKQNIKYTLAEGLWTMMGCNRLNFIGKFASLWNSISDDNKTVNSAYGYIMRYKYGFNQINKVIEILAKEPTSRRAIIIINEVNEDVYETLDEQCTIFLQFFVRDNKLDCHAVMRSNDIVWGLPYDIAMFVGTQKIIAKSLGIECGNYYHTTTSLHVYERHFEKVDDILGRYYDMGVRYPTKYIDYNRLYENRNELFNELDKDDKYDIIKECYNRGILFKSDGTKSW